MLWRGLAEIAEKYVHKGDKLYIEGKIKTRSYDDQNGIKRYVTEIFVDNMEMLGGKSNSAPSPSENKETNETPQQADVTDDLPF